MGDDGVTAQPTGLSPIASRCSEVKLCSHDIEMLQRLNGEHADGPAVWGAWVTVVIEFLHGAGLVDRTMTERGITYAINDAGRSRLLRETRGLS